jgi:aspartate/methionine/tyrosine aminotransferase
VAAPLQEGIAAALGEAEARGYYDELRAAYHARRALLVDALRASGLKPFVPAGAYYVLADFAALPQAAGLDDVQFARWLTAEVGVAAIPPSAFYVEADRHLARTLVRFAFCKREETLQAAAERLARLAAHG